MSFFYTCYSKWVVFLTNLVLQMSNCIDYQVDLMS